MNLRPSIGLLVVVGILGVLAVPTPAMAGAFTVTKFADTNDGSCDADCSLREAVIAANGSLGPDTIVLSAGTYVLSVAGMGEDAAASGDLDITDDLTISGLGPSVTTIDGNSIDHVIHVHSGCTAEISGVTITDGYAPIQFVPDPTMSRGGGIYNSGSLTLSNSTVKDSFAVVNGGGIYNASTGATLTLSNTSVSGNQLDYHFAQSGAGIYNDGGTVVVASSTISDNVTSTYTGGQGAGGGIGGHGTLTLDSSTVTANTAGSCGGIFHKDGTLVLTDSSVLQNEAYGVGGVCSIDNTLTVINSEISENVSLWGTIGGLTGSGGTATVSGSTVSDNTGVGITNYSTLTLTNSTVLDNAGSGMLNGNEMRIVDSTISGNSAQFGGAIRNVTGTLQLTNTLIAGNEGVQFGGGIDVSSGEAVATHCVLRDNSGGNGGAVYVAEGATLKLTDSSLTNNSSSSGGALDTRGETRLVNVTIAGNTAPGTVVADGGGIRVVGGNTTLVNCTVSGNSADKLGGGLQVFPSGHLRLLNCTVYANSSGLADGGGGIDNYGTVTLKNTIVASNMPGGDCSGSGVLSSIGINLESDGSCGLKGRDLSGVDPLLAPLQDNGGATQTHALLAGSSAIDAVPLRDCTDELDEPLLTDQRGEPRPQAAACDIGAYEARAFDVGVVGGRLHTQTHISLSRCEMEEDGICLQPVEFKVKNFGVDSVPVDYDLQLSTGAPSTGGELVCQGTCGVLDPGETEMIDECEVLYTGQGTVTLTLNTSPAYGIDSDLTNNSLQTRIVVVQ